jgi:hypothetical protein
VAGSASTAGRDRQLVLPTGPPHRHLGGAPDLLRLLAGDLPSGAQRSGPHERDRPSRLLGLPGSSATAAARAGLRRCDADDRCRRCDKHVGAQPLRRDAFSAYSLGGLGGDCRRADGSRVVGASCQPVVSTGHRHRHREHRQPLHPRRRGRVGGRARCNGGGRAVASASGTLASTAPVARQGTSRSAGELADRVSRHTNEGPEQGACERVSARLQGLL